MIRVHSRNSLVCRKFNKPLPPVVEKKINRDEQPSRSCLGQTHEGSVNFAVGACFQYLNLYPDDRSRRQQVSCRQLKCPGIVRILKKADSRSAGHQLVQQRESLGSEFHDEIVEPRKVAPRPIKVSNKAELHGVSADEEHNWDAGSCSLSRQNTHQPGRDDCGHSKLDQISRQRRQSISLVSRPAIFDDQVPAFNVAGLAQTPPEASQPGGVELWRPEV